MKAKYDSNGWCIDLDSAKNRIKFFIKGGLSKNKIKSIIPKWIVYHQQEKDKLIEFLNSQQ